MFMTHGKYAGEKMSTIPSWYLNWMLKAETPPRHRGPYDSGLRQHARLPIRGGILAGRTD